MPMLEMILAKKAYTKRVYNSCGSSPSHPPPPKKHKISMDQTRTQGWLQITHQLFGFQTRRI